jgi:hypothetical protein
MQKALYKTLALLAGTALLTTAAWSQPMPRDNSDRGDRESADGGDWQSGNMSRGRYYHRWNEDRRRSMRDDDDDGAASGARFLLRSGDTRLSVTCDSRESTRACVDAALTLFDRVRTQQSTTTSSTPPSSATPNTLPPR